MKKITVKLENISTRIGDGLHGTPKYNEQGEYFFINGNNLQNGSIVIKSDTKRIATEEYVKYKKDLSDRSILISINGTIGNVAFYKNEKCILGKSACYINLKENVDKTFMYYNFLSKPFQNYLRYIATGTTIQNVPLKGIREYEFDLPPLEEQQRIAAILGALDDKIELNNKINKNLEEQASALFKHWFVDFEFPDANGKPYKSSGGALKDSELGLIPSDWSIGKFTDIIDILGGGTPNTNTPNFWNGDIPFFTPKDVKEDGFVLSTEKNITEAGLQKCNSKLYSLGTVFITARGTVGKVAIAGYEMAMNQSCYALVGKNKVQQYFVYYKTKEIVSLLKNKANGAVFDAITTRDFESEFIIIPQLEYLVLFEESVKVLMSLMYNNLIENEALVQTRETLLPKLMNNDMKLV